MYKEIQNQRLSLIDIYKLTARWWVESWREICFIVVSIFVPLSFLQVLVHRSIVNSGIHLLNMMAENVSIDSQEYLYALELSMLNQILSIAVDLCLGLIGIFAVMLLMQHFLFTNEAEDRLQGKDAILKAFLYYPKGMLMEIMCVVAIVCGVLLFVVPGLYIAFVWSLYSYAYVCRKKKGKEAFLYSHELVKANWKEILIFNVITYSLFNIAIQGFSVFYIGGNIFGEWLYHIIQRCLTIFIIGATTILFFNCEAQTFQIDVTTIEEE